MDVNGDLVISGDATEGGYGVINTSDPVYQVNLLGNSGFGVWSNSEDLYTTAGTVPCTTNVCVGRGLAPNNSCTTPSADTEADATTGWTNTDFDTFASDTESSEPDGSHSLHLTATGNGQWARSSDAMTLESGKLYEFNMVYKVANGDTGGSSFKIEFGSASGGAQYGAITNLYSTSWTTQSFVFEATGTTFWVMFQENGTDNDCDIYIDQVSLHEVTPGIVGANNFAMDSWGRDGTVAIYRQHNDATYTKDGSFYSLKAIPTAADDWISWSGGGVSTVPEWYQKFAGRTVTFGAWIYASKASHVFLQLRDSDTTAFDQSSDASDYHSGTPGWEWLEVTLDVSASTTRFQVFIVSDQTADTVTYYASSPMLVFGSSIGEGNYVAPVGEIVWLEKTHILTDYSNASIGASEDTAINMEVQSLGKLPKGSVAVNLQIQATPSAASNKKLLYLTGLHAGYDIVRVSALTTNTQYTSSSWLPLTVAGDAHIYTSSVITWSEVYVNLIAVQVS